MSLEAMNYINNFEGSAMVSVNQIRKVAADFVDGGDRDRFVVEFAKLSVNIRQDGEAEAIDLVHKINSKMALIRSGHLSVERFSEWLRAIPEPAPAINYYVAAAGFSNPINAPAVLEKPFPASPGPSYTSRGAGHASANHPR